MDSQWLALIIPMSYIIISTFFLCFPNILHSKMRYKYHVFNDLINSKKILCIGHRGGSWEGPQNTIQLLKQTKQINQMYQLDVCFTKDKKLVVHHDPDLLRTCNQFITISQVDYNQLPRLQKQIVALGDYKVKTTSNKIPLLEDVFKQFPNTPMNIQLKTFSQQSAQQFNRLVTQYHRQDITVWGVAGSNNSRLRQINPEVVNFYSAGQIMMIFFLFLIGLLPFVCLRQGIIDIPLATQSFYNLMIRYTADNKCKRCLGHFICCIFQCFTFCCRLFVPHLKKRGILTFYFILNQQQDFSKAIDIGCSGIMTDLPTKLNKYIRQKNLQYEEETSSI